ncbi:MAG: hypothetical protein C4288_02015 [Leptolyngbya sp. ERB_1_1]
MKRKLTALLVATVTLIPAAVKAQEFGIPQGLLIEQSSNSSTESQILIRVRKAGDRSNLCRAGSQLGIAVDGYDFLRLGSVANRFDFPRPDGSNYFELPTRTKNPDIIGCVASFAARSVRSRNLLIINILKAIENSPTKVEPTPYNPPYNPNQPPYFNRAQ